MRVRATGSAIREGPEERVNCLTALIKMGSEHAGAETGSGGEDNSRPAGSSAPASEERRVLAGASGAYLDAT